MQYAEWIRVLCTAIPLPMAKLALEAIIKECGGDNVRVPAISKAACVAKHERAFKMVGDGLENAEIARRLRYSIRHVQRLRRECYFRRRRNGAS